MDLPGFEPGAFRMQSERDTTTLHTQKPLVHVLNALLKHLHSINIYKFLVNIVQILQKRRLFLSKF